MCPYLLLLGESAEFLDEVVSSEGWVSGEHRGGDIEGDTNYSSLSHSGTAH